MHISCQRTDTKGPSDRVRTTKFWLLAIFWRHRGSRLGQEGLDPRDQPVGGELIKENRRGLAAPGEAAVEFLDGLGKCPEC